MLQLLGSGKVALVQTLILMPTQGLAEARELAIQLIRFTAGTLDASKTSWVGYLEKLQSCKPTAPDLHSL